MRKFDPQKRKKIIIFLISLIFMAVVGVIIGLPLIRYARSPEQFRALVNDHTILSRVLYLLMQIFQVIFALVPGEPFELLAGYAFGAIEGTLLCLLGTLAGEALVFTLTKKFGLSFVHLFFSEEDLMKVRFLQRKDRLYPLVFLVFFIPGTPKDLLSYVAGLTPIRLLPYLLLTSVARLPSIITSTVSGSAAGDKNYALALIVFGITAVISGIGLLCYRVYIKKQNNG